MSLASIESVLLPLSPAVIVVVMGYLAPTISALLEYIAYIVLKMMYGKTHGENNEFKLLMVELKSELDIGFMLRLALLWTVIFSPLITILLSTVLSVAFVFDSILIKVQSFPLLGAEIVYLFLFLYAVILLIRRFFGKYGAVYKLPILYFVRDDIEQIFGKHMNLYLVLAEGTIMYATTIIILLIDFIDAYSVLSKGVVGVVVFLLLDYVLRNKRYENAINLIKKLKLND